MPPLAFLFACCISLPWPADVPPAGLEISPDTVIGFPQIGSIAEDRLRLRQLLGQAPVTGFLLRSPSTLADAVAHRVEDATGEASTAGENEFRWSPIAPELHTVWNSDIPFSLNEGALFAGRGLSGWVSTGVRMEYRGATLVLAPRLLHERNRDFQTFSMPHAPGGARHPLSSPFHHPPQSMDMPQRFGEKPRTLGDAGQSSLTVRSGPVAFGAATENLWWGPGIRNALLMSNHAAGIPHLFVRTAEPVETRIGSFEARWMLGRLSESDYFDYDETNDYRSLNALAVVYSPSFDRGLSLGIARAVYGPADGGGVPFGAMLDVFRGVGRPSAEPGTGLLDPAPDQLTTLFARWVFPDAGFETYGEWGRYAQPKNVRDFLELPQHSRGYTVGLQFARPVAAGAAFRLQAEVTNLEPSTSYRVRPIGEWYASRTVPQGFTHRGRPIGASIGPSGSSQWLAGDVFGGDWNGGVFLGRIRWENEALYSYLPEFRRADVSVFGGIRGGTDLGPVTVSAEYALTTRLNYLFQAQYLSPIADRGVDIRNHTLKLTLSTPFPFSPATAAP